MSAVSMGFVLNPANNPPTLSILIVTRNGSKRLPDVFKHLQTLRSLVSCEVVVCVDDRSTDHTQATALQYSPHTHSIEFRGFGHAKEHGRSLCGGCWVLSLDDDEHLTPQAAREIADACTRPPTHVYTLDVRTHIAGRPVRFGPWASERRVRLFPRMQGRWSSDDRVHESLNTSLPIAHLGGTVVHHTAQSARGCYEKHLHYGRVAAQTRTAPPSVPRALRHASWRLMRGLWVHGGVWCGWAGWWFAYCQSVATFIKWAERAKEGTHTAIEPFLDQHTP